MPNAALTALLAELFAAHGWKTTQDAALEGRSGTVYGAPVLVEDDDRVILVERRGPDATVDAPLLEEMSRVVADTGADAGLLAHLGPLSDEARRRAAGIILWDQATVAELVGKTRLAVAAGTPLPALPLEAQAPIKAVLPPAFQDEAAEPEDDVLDLSAFDMFDAPPSARSSTPADPPAPTPGPVASTRPEGWPADLPPPPPMSRPPAPQAAPDTAYPIMTPRVAPEQAAQQVRDRLFSGSGRPDLVLQPVHLIDFECDLLVEGSLSVDTVEGRVEVHGTSKAVRDVDPLWIDPGKTSPAAAHDVATVDERTLRITEGRAVEIAHAALLKTYTRIVEIETADEDEDFVIMERKDVAPRPDQVRLTHLGVVHRPHWRLHGSNGACLVDAMTGDVVGEDLRMADADIMVLD